MRGSFPRLTVSVASIPVTTPAESAPRTTPSSLSGNPRPLPHRSRQALGHRPAQSLQQMKDHLALPPRCQPAAPPSDSYTGVIRPTSSSRVSASSLASGRISNCGLIRHTGDSASSATAPPSRTPPPSAPRETCPRDSRRGTTYTSSPAGPAPASARRWEPAASAAAQTPAPRRSPKPSRPPSAHPASADSVCLRNEGKR